MRILLVEDDVDLGEVAAAGLRQAAYAVDVVRTVGAADEALRLTTYDVACIDLGLPDGDGRDLLRRMTVDPELRRPRRTIVVTARDGVADRVAGLDAGADDYLVKPFDLAELLARVRAVGRREDETGAVLRSGDIELDDAAHRATRGGVDLELTARELALLRHLMRRPGQGVSAEELLEHVWDAHADPFTSSVRVILSRLRRKLGSPTPIETVVGAGYRWAEGR